MQKYFIEAGKPVQVILSKEQYDYLQKALKFAIAKGFKITLFDDKGKPFAHQG